MKRILTNIAADRIEDARAFHTGILGWRLVMDHGRL